MILAAIAMIAMLVVSTTTRAAAADDLATWVTENAELVVDARVAATDVVTAENASIWTIYTLETSGGTLTVFNQGGVDTSSGRWQYLSHSAELLVGSDVVVALERAEQFVPADVLPTGDDAWVIFGGVDGVVVKSSSAADTDQAVRAADLLPSSYYTGSRWAAMPVNIRMNTALNSQIRPGTTDAVLRSIERWGNIGDSDAAFRYAGTSNTSSIGNPPLTNTVFAAPLSGQLGTTVWTGAVGLETTTSFDIVLNSGTLPFGSTWSLGATAGSYDVESVILHELGHVLGVGHTGEAYSIMYPTLYRNESKLTLSRIEIEAARTLYPTSECGFATPDAIVGSPGNDVLYGTSGDDVIIAGLGNDVILGGGGNDRICGGDGTDSIWGQSGNDTIYGGAGADQLRGGSGTDTIRGGADNDDINGGRDNDTVYGDGGDDTIKGGTGDDTLEGGDGNDFVSGNGGSDRVRGGNGNDEVRGGPRPDTLYGDANDDILKGYGGADTFFGGSGNDQLIGGQQNDKRFDGGVGSDLCNGGIGDESLAIVTGCTTIMHIP